MWNEDDFAVTTSLVEIKIIIDSLCPFDIMNVPDVTVYRLEPIFNYKVHVAIMLFIIENRFVRSNVYYLNLIKNCLKLSETNKIIYVAIIISF